MDPIDRKLTFAKFKLTLFMIFGVLFGAAVTYQSWFRADPEAQSFTGGGVPELVPGGKFLGPIVIIASLVGCWMFLKKCTPDPQGTPPQDSND